MELDQELAAEPREVSRARHALTEALRRWGVEGDSYDVAVLLTSELVTNAIKHGKPPVRLRARLAKALLHVEVDDGAHGEVHETHDVPWDALGGRGLQLVDTLADRWGTRQTGPGKRVWFELDMAS